MTKTEINLLPPLIKRERRRSILGQRLSRLYWWLVLVVVVTGGALGISWVLLRQTTEQLRQTTAQKLEQKNEVGIIRSLNQFLSAMAQRTKSDRAWLPDVMVVLAAVPPEVHVRDLAVVAGSQQLVIEGTATNRAAVATLAERLHGLAWVEKVEAPLTNLVVGQDGSFSFTLQRKETP